MEGHTAAVGRTQSSPHPQASLPPTAGTVASDGRPFLDTKSALDRARRLNLAPNLFVVMRICSPVVLNYLDAAFKALCPRKDF